MHRCLKLARLSAVIAVCMAFSVLSVGAEALETAIGPKDILGMEREGRVNVRVLRAWGRLPDRYVALGQTLRKDAGLDLLGANAAELTRWIDRADGGDAVLAPVRRELSELLGYLERGDYLDWEAVTDEASLKPGALVRQDGRRWVHGTVPAAQDAAGAPADSARSGQAARSLFNGDMGQHWLPYQADGGKKSFAQIADRVLDANVPAGNGWGRTGMHSSEAVATCPRGGESSVRLSFLLDAQRTSDAVFSLVPAEAGTNDEWQSHHIRLGIHLEAEDGPRTMTLWIARQAVMSREIAEVPERVDIVLRPDDAVIVTDGSGRILLQGVLNLDAPKDGYRLYALTGSTSRRRGKPLRMALRSIDLVPEPFAAGPAHDSIPDGGQHVVLFEKGILGRWWSPLAGQGGDFRAHARLDDGEVAVDVPAGARWGKVGIYSPGALLWLDRFGPGAEAGVTFEFDPARTTGFVVALSPLYNLKDNDPSRPHVWVQWNAKEDGSGGRASILINPDIRKTAWEGDTPASAPDKVTVRVSPDGVLVQGLGGPEERYPWKCAMPNLGLRVYAFSQAEKGGLPVRMALKRITMDRVTGALLPEAVPAAGVEPLNVETLFDGREGGQWEPYGLRGGEFAKYGRFEGGRLVADVPADTYSWPKTGMVSREQVVECNERVQRTPYAVRIACDPRGTSGVEAVFRSSKSGDMEKGAAIAASFVRHDTGPDAGYYVLSLSGENAVYRNWSRRVDARWVEANWDGVLEVLFGDGWAEAGLAGGTRVRGTELRTGKGWGYHMAVTTCPAHKSGPATLALKAVTGGWVTPHGMTADDRWTFVDDEDFQPDAFLDQIADSLPREE